jgi:hypothetical protein
MSVEVVGSPVGPAANVNAPIAVAGIPEGTATTSTAVVAPVVAHYHRQDWCAEASGDGGPSLRGQESSARLRHPPRTIFYCPQVP